MSIITEDKECFFLSTVNNGESIYQDNNNHHLIRRSFPSSEKNSDKEEYFEIISDLEIIGQGLYDNKKINFNQKDIFIMNMVSLIDIGFHNLIDYKQSDIVSILINNLYDTTNFIIDIFKKHMQFSNKIRIICFSKRNNSSKDKKFSYLTKLFFLKDNKEYMANVFKDYLKIYEFKLKIEDLSKNSNNTLEKGIKKNNWITINNELLKLI